MSTLHREACFFVLNLPKQTRPTITLGLADYLMLDFRAGSIRPTIFLHCHLLTEIHCGGHRHLLPLMTLVGNCLVFIDLHYHLELTSISSRKY
jgi:hypothetical protein